MVAVKTAARRFHAHALLCLHAPRHIEHGVEIVAQHAGLRAAERLTRQAIHVLEELFLRFLRQVAGADPCAVFVELRVAVSLAQLILQHLDLLAQDHVLLDLADALAHLAFNVLLHRNDADLALENLVHTAQTHQRAQLLKHRLLILIAQIAVLRDEISEKARVGRVHDRGEDALWLLGQQLAVLAEERVGLAQHRLGARAVPRRLFLADQLDLRLQKRLALPQAAQPRTAAALHDDAHHGVRRAQDLNDARDGADLVEVLFLRQLNAQLALRDKEDLLPRLHRALQRAHGDLALHVKARGHAGKDRESAQRKGRDVFGDGFHRVSLRQEAGSTGGSSAAGFPSCNASFLCPSCGGSLPSTQSPTKVGTNFSMWSRGRSCGQTECHTSPW